VRRRAPRPPATPLGGLRPTPARWAAVAVAVLATAVLCWFVGVAPGRAVGLAAVVALIVLVLRMDDSGEDRWPQPPAPRTRPGRQVVATTTRQLDAARGDAGDRAVVADRLARLQRGQRHDGHADRDSRDGPDRDPTLVDDVRAAVGLPRRSASGTARSTPQVRRTTS
jgi:hypothetical protein